jgi:hypothetical protein
MPAELREHAITQERQSHARDVPLTTRRRQAQKPPPPVLDTAAHRIRSAASPPRRPCKHERRRRRTILKHQAALADAALELWWQEIAYRVLPSEAQFTTIDTEGTKRTERLFDSTAATANERFAAVMEDLLTPRTQRWHGLKPEVMLGAHDEI